MGGRANPLQDATVIQDIGQTVLVRQMERQLCGTSTSHVGAAQASPVTPCGCAPTGAFELRAA